MIKKNSFLQQTQETSTDENSKLMSFLQKMMGKAPANDNSNNLLANKKKANLNSKGNY